MSRMIVITSVFVLLSVAADARAEVKGHCEYESRQATFVDGVAWPVLDEDSGAATGEQLLVFSTYDLDEDTIWRATANNREDAVSEQHEAGDESARLQLTLQPEAGMVSQQYLWLSPGTNLSRSSNQIGEYQPAKASADRVAGHYRFADEADDPRCELDFDLALLGDPATAPPLPGTPLPRDGGEPGLAYLAMSRALLAGDIEAMAKLLPPDNLAEMRKAQQQPEFAAQLVFMQALTPRDIRITGGRQHGDRAWLEFTATEDGKPRLGQAEMARQGERWYLIRESTRDPN